MFAMPSSRRVRLLPSLPPYEVRAHLMLGHSKWLGRSDGREYRPLVGKGVNMAQEDPGRSFM